MRQIIEDAIQNRRHLEFTYDGLPRLVQPAAVGVSRAGNDVLRCFQIKGEHNKDGHVWNLCTLTKISDLRVTEQKFDKPPPGYTRGDKGMIEIYAEL